MSLLPPGRGAWDGRVDAALARRWEDQFISAFRRSFGQLEVIPGPEEGVEYDRRPEREQVREWDDREEVKRHLMRTAATARSEDMPVNRGVQCTILVKPFLSAMVPKVSVVAACCSPLAAISKGPVMGEGCPAGMTEIDEVLDRALIHERTGVFHFVAICSTTGWEESLRDPLPQGRNYLVSLLSPKPPGWIAWQSQLMPPRLQVVFDPEDGETKRNRVVQTIRSHPDLQVTGGLMLLEELAEEAVVPYAVAGEAAWDYAQENPDFEVRKVNGSQIVQRRAVRPGLGG